jgi:hypothetical protein
MKNSQEFSVILTLRKDLNKRKIEEKIVQEKSE